MRAARLLGAAEALRTSIGAPVPPVEHAAVEATADTIRATLGEAEFAQARAEGQAMSFEQAVAYALDVPA